MAVETLDSSTNIQSQNPDSGLSPDGAIANPSQKDNARIPRSMQLLEELRPPSPGPEDADKDPVEAQISHILGDVTLPRSFLPAIEAIAVESVARNARGLGLFYREKPHERKRREKSGKDWPGKSPELDKQLAEEKKIKTYNSLMATPQMTKLRNDAWILFEEYMLSGVNRSSLAEAHFLRRSHELWEKMSAFAKDYLVYGDDGYPTVAVDEREIIEVLGDIQNVASGISRTRSRGIIHLERNESNERFYRFNDLHLTFDQDRIASLRIDEGTARDEHSPLFSFIMSEAELGGVENGFSDGTMVGPFNVGLILHEYGDAEHNIIIQLKTQNWTNEQIFNFLGRYLKVLKTESRLEGQPAKLQIIDGGIITAEALRT